MTIWRDLTKSREQLLDAATCDLCGEKANTVHFVPYDGSEQCVTECLFACARHDAGGYWLSIDEHLRGKAWPHTTHHIEGKVWGPKALMLIANRLDDLRIITPPSNSGTIRAQSRS
jgi:hypothetical protein